MKKVVLLAPYFLPRRRVGAWRPFKFAIHLKEFGWEPHVITIKESEGQLTRKERSLLSDIPIYKIKSPFDLTHRLNNGFAYNGFTNSDEGDVQTKRFNPGKTIINWIDKQFPIDSWLPLFIYRRRFIERIIKDVDPHLLWSTGDPWSSHWLAGKLVDKFDLPWVADFRDPWTLGNVNLKNRSDFSFEFDQKEEKKVLRKASVLTFNAERTEQLYQNRFENIESHTIYNCYDSTLFSDKNGAEQLSVNHLNLIFFGKFRPLSPARPSIQLLEECYKQNSRLAAKIRMYSFGKLSTQEKALAKKKGVYKNFIAFKHIPLEEALPVLRQADILWLSTHPSRENIIPAKLWDYLAAQKPIISIAPNPEIEDILRRTGAGMQLDADDHQALAELLLNCTRAKQNDRSMPISVEYKNEIINQFDATPATQKLANIFNSLS